MKNSNSHDSASFLYPGYINITFMIKSRFKFNVSFQYKFPLKPLLISNVNSKVDYRKFEFIHSPSSVCTSLRLHCVIKPTDFDPHVTAGGLPQRLDSAHVGPIGPTGGEKDRAISNGQWLVFFPFDFLVHDATASRASNPARWPSPQLLRMKESRHATAATLFFVGTLKFKNDIFWVLYRFRD
jgi:hypothetical protein